jgi:hypothetical protein
MAVNRTRCGGAARAGRRYAVHFRQPALATPPHRAGYLYVRRTASHPRRVRLRSTPAPSRTPAFRFVCTAHATAVSSRPQEWLRPLQRFKSARRLRSLYACESCACAGASRFAVVALKQARASGCSCWQPPPCLRSSRRLTWRSTGRAAAGQPGPVGGTRYIFANRPWLPRRIAPVTSTLGVTARTPVGQGIWRR